MDLIRARGLVHRQDGRAVLGGVSLAVGEGMRVGLIGTNGSGKSTLLRILAVKTPAHGGEIVTAPGVRVVLSDSELLPAGKTVRGAAERPLRRLRELECELRDEEQRLASSGGSLERYGELLDLFEGSGGYEAEAKLAASLTALGFPEELRDRRIDSLSGGESTRLRLALALADPGDVLLLDDASSHLDLAARRWLAGSLNASPAAVVFATHDRALLDRVSTHIALLHQGSLQLYRGNYTAYRRSKEHQAVTAHREQRTRRREVERLNRTMEALARRETPAKAQQRKAIATRVARLEAGLDATSVSPSPRGLTLQGRRAEGTLLEARRLSKSWQGREILAPAWLDVEVGDRVALLGANGSGKSTLLALLSGELEPDHPQGRVSWSGDARLFYMDQQNRGLKPDQSPLEQLACWVSEARARMLLSLVGIGSDRCTAHPCRLSPGERARAAVALLMACDANLLLLDEPTEFLDIDMIERLEEALVDTPAAIVLATHDEMLASRVAKRVWLLEGGRVGELPSGVRGYLRGEVKGLQSTTMPERRSDVDAPLPESKESLEEQLERLEAELGRIEDRLADPLRLSPREVDRLQALRVEVIDDLSQLYDDRLAPAGPEYLTHVSDVTVSGDRQQQRRWCLESDVGLSASLLVDSAGQLGHLALYESDSLCPLPHAAEAALDGMVRIAMERIGVRTLQCQTLRDLSVHGFARHEDDWWTLTRNRYERRR